MQPTRRDLLRFGIGSATLLACGNVVPRFLARSALALDGLAVNGKGRVLVVLELTGGNDGLNTVVPYADDLYHKNRPKLHLTKEQVWKIDDHVGLHPALRGFGDLLQAQQLAVVQSVGYPNPNRSHFESMAIWQTADLKPTGDTPGWLARGLDRRPVAAGSDVPALHVGADLLPQALAGGERHIPSIASLEQFRRRLNVPASAGIAEQRTALDQIGAEARGPAGSLLQFVERSTLLTYASSARLESVMGKGGGATGYPESYGLAQRLKLVAQLIKAGLTTSLYYTHLGGFDTHANQAGTHDGLLREVGDSLKAFLEDLKKAGATERVLVLIFSEFGRRVSENGSAGTDHGTAAPVFLLGAGVQDGAHGPRPNLSDLDAGGDPKHAIDFRQVYATVLDHWLGCPSEKVLGEKFHTLRLLKKA
jgi:uncharacterized protein (DUF1501 family)